MMDILDDLQVFFGATSNATARVYARLPHAVADLRFNGRVTGPFCRHSRTLPAAIPLQVRPGDTLLAEAVVPDPCFWTPELPMMYRFDIECSIATSPAVKTQRWLGIRPLGVHERRFLWSARNWVLRAAEPSSNRQDWSAWREQELACWLHSPDDALLEELSHEGVLVAAKVDDFADLSRLSRWPAVTFAIFDGEISASNVARLAPNLLLGRWFEEHELLECPSWARFVVADVFEADHFAARAALCESPVIGCRGSSAVLDVTSIRAECDRLQRDLAGKGEFAGYVILQPKETVT